MGGILVPGSRERLLVRPSTAVRHDRRRRGLWWVRPLAIKLVRRVRETGSTEPGKISGQCKPLLTRTRTCRAS